MLPFVKDNNRKWQCFICGREHTDFETFKEHIIEKHEEGRDYILCPLKRCSTPVRDVRMHIKIKHPDQKVPEKGQMKAMIWRDQGGKKVKTRKPRFRDGFMVSIKNNGREMHYRSGLECEVYECLEVLNEVSAYDVEPIKGGIPYLFEGEPHHYFPDLSIKFGNGDVEIWEVKPMSQTSLPINDAKWTAAEHFCQTRGWKFIVVTEKHLEKLKKKIQLDRATNAI